MVKRLSVMLATLAWLVTGQVSPAWPQWLGGNEFVETCLSDGSGEHLSCLLYIIGVADMISGLSNMEPVIPNYAPTCFPDGTTTGQLHRIVVKYLKAHPEETHTPAVVLVMVALREAFPCQ